jgi:hypothetical protein
MTMSGNAEKAGVLGKGTTIISHACDPRGNAIPDKTIPLCALSLFKPPDKSMATSKQLQKLTRDDVTKHNKDGDLVRLNCF